MHRRNFLKLLPPALLPLFSGCALTKVSRIDPYHFFIRSERFKNLKEERELVGRAKLTRTEDGRIRVLFVKGSPYDRGYQHGVLLREEVQDNFGTMYRRALEKFHFEELFSEVYERMRPHIPAEYIEEMHGLAHGSRMPLHIIHHIHVLPSIGEWSGRKRVRKVLKAMMKGVLDDDFELGTSCSNLSASPEATGESMYTVRILDWGLHRISKLHEYPLITVSVPEKGYASANIGWVGFVGAVSGMNAQGITLGEMGYGDPQNETLHGQPMPFLLRDVLSYASNLADVRKIIGETPGTNSFGYLMSDGKNGEAEMYIRDRDRFRVFKPGVDARDKDEYLPAVSNVVYGGHFEERMASLLTSENGKITLKSLQEHIIPTIAMKSNFQNVIYEPNKLRFWVNNAKSKDAWAASQPYSFFDLKKALEEFFA